MTDISTDPAAELAEATRCEHGIRWPHRCDDCDKEAIKPHNLIAKVEALETEHAAMKAELVALNNSRNAVVQKLNHEIARRIMKQAELMNDPAIYDICQKLRTMYSHRGDGIPTQYVNPDGKEAVEIITAMKARIEELEGALAFYRDNVSLCNRYDPEGDTARDRLAKDYGQRALKALGATDDR